MRAKADVEAGICGFRTTAYATSKDQQHVVLDIQTDCEKIQRLSLLLKEAGSIDAYQEINPAGESIILANVRSCLKGCCAGCAVPVGIFKAMQVAAGLALPKEITITMTKE